MEVAVENPAIGSLYYPHKEEKIAYLAFEGSCRILSMVKGSIANRAFQLDNPRRPYRLVWHDRALPVIVRGIGACRFRLRNRRLS